ncbi:MAG TPA: DUF3443 domain-containing protein [Steroidobacteraceae bacterium]|jgi:hypothetical protein|nr:DUF3443 domain-containing protein [Steroidobacteraceae bacterium]
MRQAYRWTVLPGMCLLALCALAACGGGGSSGGGSSTGSTTTAHNFAAGGPNVVPISVNAGPADPSDQTFNIPLVTVTVCEPGTTSCATINDVLVDTGSYGLRLMASALAGQSVTLAPMADPNDSANAISECLPFADGYSWGEVASAIVTIGGETSSGAVPVQVINDSSSPSPAAPSTCTSDGISLNSVGAFDANGVLGIGPFVQDCGSGCATSATNVYYTCTSANSCSETTLPLEDQVANPVARFPTDNNGVIVQLASISAAGAATGTGYLVFGIGTESNNGLGNATVLTTDNEGNFTTMFDGQTLGSSFIDSGSNGLYFPDSSLALCGQTVPANEFYCPSSTASLSATNQGEDGTSSSVPFQIANLSNLLNDNNGSHYAFDDAGGPAETIAQFGAYFDWGLPFFYGRTTFFAIDGASAGGISGPFYAY